MVSAVEFDIRVCANILIQENIEVQILDNPEFLKNFLIDKYLGNRFILCNAKYKVIKTAIHHRTFARYRLFVLLYVY